MSLKDDEDRPQGGFVAWEEDEDDETYEYVSFRFMDDEYEKEKNTDYDRDVFYFRFNVYDLVHDEEAVFSTASGKLLDWISELEPYYGKIVKIRRKGKGIKTRYTMRETIKKKKAGKKKLSNAINVEDIE